MSFKKLKYLYKAEQGFVFNTNKLLEGIQKPEAVGPPEGNDPYKDWLRNKQNTEGTGLAVSPEEAFSANPKTPVVAPKTKSQGLGFSPMFANAVLGAFSQRHADNRQRNQIQTNLANPFNSIPVVTTPNEYLNQGLKTFEDGGSWDEEDDWNDFIPEEEVQASPVQTEEETPQEDNQEQEEPYQSIINLDEEDTDEHGNPVDLPSEQLRSAPVSNYNPNNIPPVDRIAHAIGNIESSGNYDALGPVVTKGMYKGQRALGKYQIMPGNLPQWSQEALGRKISPEEFLNTPELQETIAKHQMGKIYNKVGNPDDVASIWLTGKRTGISKSTDDNGTGSLDYVNKFRKHL